MAASTDDRDLYRVLGVTRAATTEEIRQVYLGLVRVLHPDRMMDATDTERALADRRMREINGAWAVLGDAQARTRYDDELRAAARRPRFEGATARDARRPGPSGGGARSRPSSSGASAGAGRSGDRMPVPERDWDDDEDDVELSRHEAFFIRRGIWIVIAVIAVAIFIGSAYAGSGGTTQKHRPATPACVVTASQDCQ